MVLGTFCFVAAISVAAYSWPQSRLFHRFVQGVDHHAYLSMIAGLSASDNSQREKIVPIVIKIQRADYEGDRPALKRLYQQLAPFTDDKALAPKVHYWRGFARWRSALNGFNDGASPKEIEEDLKLAITEFQTAMKQDPSFIDAKAATGSTMGLLSFLYTRNADLAPEFRDTARVRDYLRTAMNYMTESETAEPENPRVLWMLGPIRWIFLPPELGGGEDKAFDTYMRGLKAARAQRSIVKDPLMPSWGEAEILMNLGFTNLNRKTPDIAAAERYAREALAMVPYWHYVRDILIPQIEEAKKKTQANP